MGGRYGELEEIGDEKDQYAAFVIKSDGSINLIKLGRALEIDAAIRQWRASIDQESRTSWRFLKGLVWAPLDNALAGAKTVWISPDGQLWQSHGNFSPSDESGSGNSAAPSLVLQVDSAREFIRRTDTSLGVPAAKHEILLVGDWITAGRQVHPTRTANVGRRCPKLMQKLA